MAVWASAVEVRRLVTPVSVAYGILAMARS